MAKKREKIDLREVKVRKAAGSDFKEVMNINRDIYWGFDYLPALYMPFNHHPDVQMYVAVLEGNIVSLLQVFAPIMFKELKFFKAFIYKLQQKRVSDALPSYNYCTTIHKANVASRFFIMSYAYILSDMMVITLTLGLHGF